MDTRLYQLLDEQARVWWYNLDLRKRGEIAEARRRERRAIRDYVGWIRTAKANEGHLFMGRGGWSLQLTEHNNVSGYDCDSRFIEAAILAGVPTIDSRTIPDENLVPTIKFPMIAVGQPDEEPWTMFSRAPFHHVAALYEIAGATIWNWRA